MSKRGEFEFDVEKLLAAFGTADRKTKANLRKRIREVANPIAADARAQAGTWSTRIPGAIRVSTSFSSRRAGVNIRVSSKKAPHARPFENVSKTGFFRHPVFPDSKRETRDEWTWVSQDARPFLVPAVQQNVDRVRAATRQAVIDAAREAGFI